MTAQVPASASAEPVLRDSIKIENAFTLRQALDIGLRDSARTAAARAQLDIARSNLVQAGVLPNPAFFIDNQYQFTYKIGASILVEAPWRLVLRKIAARERITQAELEIARTLWLYRGEVRRAYVEAVIAKELFGIRRQLQLISQKLRQVSGERFNSGDVPKLDVERADLAVILADMQKEQADVVVKQSQEQLNVLLGRAAEHVIDLPLLENAASDLLPHLKLPPKEQLLAAAYENRLELKSVKQQNVVGKAGLRSTYGNILPTSRFNFGAMTEDKINSNLNRQTWFFQGLVDLPVLDRQQGEIARLRATIKQLGFEYQAQKNIIEGQVLLAYRKMQNAQVRIEKYRAAALRVSARINDTADLAYKMGQTDITSALTVQQDNVSVQSQYLDSVLAFQLALNELEQAVGIPL